MARDHHAGGAYHRCSRRTFCVLDSKRNDYSPDQRELIKHLAELVENDLKNLLDMETLRTQADLRAREVRHRIKNQFNLLISYVDLHTNAKHGTQSFSEVGEHIKNGIRTLAAVHERLTMPSPGMTISLLRYLDEILNLLVAASPVEAGVTVSGDDASVDEETLVPLAAIVNELVTNSFKHAFGEVAEPHIAVDLRTEPNTLRISYRDNGGPSKHASGRRSGRKGATADS
ncbi:MAG: sensor histidine kinase [Spirochaetota bacterium]